LLAVSKTFSAEEIKKAYECNQFWFGENKVQELEEKYTKLPSSIEWHVIGHLQSNKAVKAIRIANWIHSVDSEKLIKKLDSIAGENGKRTNILLEINLSGEETKSGLRGEIQYLHAVDCMMNAKNLNFQGLMTMAQENAGEKVIRGTFANLRQIRDKIEADYKISLPELSMGMSQDFEYAIMEGSTIVRVGSAIFGKRDYQK